MSVIEGDHICQRMDRQVRPSREILVEASFEFILKHRALGTWERRKMREIGGVDNHRTQIPHDIDEGQHDAIRVLVDAEILPGDADPYCLLAIPIQKLR